ncbi:MAG: 50S ribosomal protein L10 [Roseburia sp.]|nr:50S ribosomal protein L10 [Anaeroplasma bactoclasticum]MCM1196674.1 50S ribosomal protein L10 [Roseburia sp.]MCM1557188.1 50S ribosomal protein L10 [Anaeroplasma bactoclasticum]
MKEILLQKQKEVAEVSEKMKSSASVVAFKYQGLTVEAFQNLRKSMRELGCEISVIKNNISRRAAKECGYDLDDALVGPIALAFSKDDLVAPSKVLFKVAGENNKIEVVKGVVDGDVYSFDQLKTLSQLPSYETLLTQLAAGMLGTLSQLSIGLNMLVEKGQEA